MSVRSSDVGNEIISEIEELITRSDIEFRKKKQMACNAIANNQDLGKEDLTYLKESFEDMLDIKINKEEVKKIFLSLLSQIQDRLNRGI